MDVFVAIFLLFGVFSLGSATNNDADHDSSGLELSTTANERQDLPDKALEAGDVERRQWRDCLADRHVVIYRDLTVSYDNEIETETETEMTRASDVEEVSSDE